MGQNIKLDKPKKRKISRKLLIIPLVVVAVLAIGVVVGLRIYNDRYGKNQYQPTQTGISIKEATDLAKQGKYDEALLKIDNLLPKASKEEKIQLLNTKAAVCNKKKDKQCVSGAVDELKALNDERIDISLMYLLQLLAEERNVTEFDKVAEEIRQAVKNSGADQDAISENEQVIKSIDWRGDKSNEGLI